MNLKKNKKMNKIMIIKNQKHLKKWNGIIIYLVMNLKKKKIKIHKMKIMNKKYKNLSKIFLIIIY